MEPKFKLINVENNEILNEFSIEDSELAFSEAARMEEMGLSVKLVNPGAAESLGLSLGISSEDLESLRSSLEEEIESHEEDSCCFKKDP